MNKNGLRVSEYSGLVHMVRFDIVKYSKFNIRNLWYRAIVQIYLSVIPEFMHHCELLSTLFKNHNTG
jgi:hypothetical protein